MQWFVSRFGRPSSSLEMKGLLQHKRKGLWLAFAVAVGIHLSLTRLVVLEAEKMAVKPLTTQFIKRQPRLTKPLELKKRPRPKRRQIQRKMVAVRARLDRGEVQAGFQPTRALGGLAKPRAEIGRVAGLAGVRMEPASVAQAVEGAKDVEQTIDMSLELLDIEALDTGKYHALVVQDPVDKRNITGFCHLAIVYSRALYPPVPDPIYCFEGLFLPGFLRIAAAMNEYTGIKTDILGRLSPDDAEIFKAPWLLLFGYWQSLGLTLSDLENMGRYLVSGGFIFADCINYLVIPGGNPQYMSLRNSLLGGLATQGVKVIFEKLPNSHAIYHCYFDFEGPPIASDAGHVSIHPAEARVLGYTEGLEIDGRLVVLLSGKGYSGAWTLWGPDNYANYGGWTTWDPTHPLRFAVNTIVFALTQEGSITHRLMESVR